MICSGQMPLPSRHWGVSCNARDSRILLLAALRTTESPDNTLVRYLTDAARTDDRLHTIELGSRSRELR